MSISTEFPRFDLTTLPAPIPRHWSDESWHNDVSPSFRVKELPDGSYLKVWIDFEDESERELSGKRFIACWYNDDVAPKIGTIIETDDWPELLAAVARAENEAPR